MNDMKRWVNRCFLAAMLLFAASHSPAALAIDCQAATSKIDKVICSGYGMPGQDAKLNADYGEAMKRLSPEGQSALRADQRNWLRYRATACGFTDHDSKPGDMHCLIRQFVRRDDTLWSIAHQQAPSPYVFSARSTYETVPNPSGGRPFWSESSIPQIDRQSLSTNLAWSDAKAWNALIAKLIGGPEKLSVCPGGKGDIYKEGHVTTASLLLISVTVDRDDQCPQSKYPLISMENQDHFMSETQYSIVMMRGDIHQLAPAGIFSSGDDWKRLLTERLEQEVKKQADDHREDWHPSVDAMRRVTTNPSNWILGGDAFRIRVNQAALSQDQFIGGLTVTIPWSDLQGVLSFKGKRILNAPNW